MSTPEVVSPSPKIAVTLDVDWSIDAVVFEAIQLFSRRGIKVTLFCTGISEVAKSADEVALHPNFEDCGGMQQMFDRMSALKSLYPKAIGIRSHANWTGSRLLPMYERLGLTYESNYVCVGTEIAPFWMSDNLVQLPVFFMDTAWISRSVFGGVVKKTLGDLQAGTTSLLRPSTTPRVFVFHPVHLFANTCSEEHYQLLKTGYNDLDYLRANTGKSWGVRDLALELVDRIASSAIQTVTLGELREDMEK